MRKKSKLVVGLAFAFLAITQFSYLVPNIIKADAENQSTYTITTDDGYYAKTTYYLTEQAYQDYLDNINSSINLSAKTAKTSIKNVDAMDEESEFVFAAVQTVCVYERAGDDGNVTESRLLTGKEIEVYETSSNTVRANDATNNTIGSDNESLYYLDISMSVVYNSSSNQYTITGKASWDDVLVWLWDTNKAAEEWDFDYIGITWGGARTLVANTHSISGKYYNGNAVSFSKQTSDSYAGYVWQFNEKSGYLGKEMKLATATVNISKVGTSENKETNAKMTYIHTYGKIKGDISLTYNSDGSAAAGVSLSETSEQWQIEIDVPGIVY